MISIIILSTCFLLNIAESSKQFSVIDQKAQVNRTYSDFLLCRSCGNDIASSDHIIKKISPESQNTFNDTLFYRDNVTVQILLNSYYVPFPIITISKSICEPADELSESDSWFPGYIWSLCFCPECGTLIGWVFMPINPSITNTSDPFYAIILESVISKTFTDSLIKYPVQSAK